MKQASQKNFIISVKIINDITEKVEEALSVFFLQNSEIEIIKEVAVPYEDTVGNKCVLVYIRYKIEKPV